MKNPPPTTEERIWSVLAHLSVLAFGMGILLPIIGWSEQRRKSKYAAFQCLQALGYQSLGYTIWVLTLLLVLVVLAVVLIAATAEQSPGDSGRVTGGLTVIFTAVVFVLMGAYALFPVVGAVACGLGKDFRYPILGKRLARYLGFEKTDQAWLLEEHEDRWVAAMGHFAAIILLWGMLAPLTTWILQARRSVFLKFQSIQTLIFQTMVTLLYFGGIFVYLIAFAVMFAVIGLAGGSDIRGAGFFGFGLFIVFSIIALIAFLFVPLFHILGQWAGYRVLKGDNYHYPLLGKLVERWTVNKAPLAVDDGVSTRGKP